MDVEQGLSVYGRDDEWIETSGLGPCIGVAIIFTDRVSMTHQSGSHASDEFDRFCEAVATIIPAPARSSIHPIVAGGQLSCEPMGVENDRAYVLSKLHALGFGKPQVRWCPENAQSNGIVINTQAKTVVVETYFEDDRPVDSKALQF